MIKMPKNNSSGVRKKNISNILFNNQMWNMYQIFYNGDFVCMSAHLENNKNIIRYGINKEEIINKIVDDQNSIISTTLTLSGLQWSR